MHGFDRAAAELAKEPLTFVAQVLPWTQYFPNAVSPDLPVFLPLVNQYGPFQNLTKREIRFARDSQNRRSDGKHKDHQDDRDGYFHFLNHLVQNRRFSVITGGSPNTAASVSVLDQG